MPEPDFHGLRDELDWIARQADFSTVTRRAGRLRTRARAMAASTMLVAVVALAFAAVTVLPSLASLRPPAGLGAGGRIEVVWAGAGDRDHLYAVLADCADCEQRLVGSDDGGRTWQKRSEFPLHASAQPVTPTVLGPAFLVLDLPLTEPGKGSGPTIRRISVDGGATWRDAGGSGPAREAAVPGTRVWGCLVYVPQGCEIVVPDPAAGSLAPLMSQPPLAGAIPVVAPPSAGYWMRGCDPATRRPAVAVSRTGGRSWETHVFNREPVADQCVFDVATTDGRTVFVTFLDRESGSPRVYRSSSGITGWRAEDRPRLPDGWTLQGASLVALDGSHVLFAGRETDFGLLVSPDGRMYTPLDGPVSEPLAPPRVVDGGRYLWYDAKGVYVSDDGLRWRTVTPD
ncbi:hypothetical protein [Micromonospora sp. NPDC006431]|uniref:hypothetical protein n=1 Tax=Micromonospora sp. NPDC006431 TaxID=3364235 RepID=UPI00367DAF10